MRTTFAALAAVAAWASCASALDNGVALTPPMGWLSWERFRCNTDCTANPDTCISEKLYMDMADRIVADGYKDVGYEYVNVDDCWSSKKRGPDGNMVPDPDRFPNGIDGLAKYMHDRGLKLGLYTDAGTLSCGGYPGLIGHEKQDIDTFASWGIDSLKVDGCYFDNRQNYPAYYKNLSQLMNNTGRPILFSCSYPAYLQGNTFINYTFASEICNGWRLYDDIQDDWGSVAGIINFWGDHSQELSAAAGPGHQNDPDMILPGDSVFPTPAGAQTQMSIWSIVAGPLLMSNDLRNMTQWQKEVLQNKEVIAINQDPLVRQGQRVSLSVGEAWYKGLSNGDIAVALRNPSTKASAHIVAPLHLVGIPTRVATGRDLWNHTDIGTVRDAVVADVEAYGTALFRLTPQ